MSHALYLRGALVPQTGGSTQGFSCPRKSTNFPGKFSYNNKLKIKRKSKKREKPVEPTPQQWKKGM